MPDIHRHDHFSLFDGFGKPKDLAKQAKEKGYTALGIANHGTISGLVQHYVACKNEEIKPILGVEAYFQPKLNKEHKRNHLCLFAKNIQGYKNLNRIMFMAEKQKYYKPIATFKDLKKYNEGIICSSACVGGTIPQYFLEGKQRLAEKALETFVEIFGDDFYLEIQPYKIDNAGTQEKVNEYLMELSEKYSVKCILTSDSHFGDVTEFSTYQKMHKMGRKSFDADEIADIYGERYMPTYKELESRFIKMHGSKAMAREMIGNLKEIEEKVDGDVLDKLPLILPKLYEKDGDSILKEKLIEGLKKRGHYGKKEYMQRVKDEFEIIKNHGFSDYFLIVQDYVVWSKKQGIGVGPGRGSVCNSLVAYLLEITEVDSVYFNLDFRRFLRADKKKLPDIDLDFETARRAEALDYITEKYKGKAAQIGSYGLYKVDNLINDLAKVCGVESKSEIDNIKKFIKDELDEDNFDYEYSKNKYEAKHYNKMYDNIIFHFSKLYKSVRYLGTHAAGVVVTGTPLLDYAGVRIIDKGKPTERKATVYDLLDAEAINIIKFDVLGLKTVETITELQQITGKHFDYSWLTDKKVLDSFKNGDTDGIFQFEKATAKEILRSIQADCFDDVCAASAMNRPGPLQMKMPQTYAENKFNENYEHDLYYEYTKETYGTIVYQEQLTQICRNIGKMSWEGSDKVLKMMKAGSMTEAARLRFEDEYEKTEEEFIAGATSNGISKKDAKEMFKKLIVYTFNKGHTVGYTMISFEEMFYKVHFPTEFWYTKIKSAGKLEDEIKYKIKAAASGNILFLPHVNYSAITSLREVDGEKIIQEGISSVKFVGEKAAKAIEEERVKNGFYKSKEDFVKRVKSRSVTSRVIEELEIVGALEFDKNKYLKRVTKYNTSLFVKGNN